jgi:hypothetical protein
MGVSNLPRKEFLMRGRRLGMVLAAVFVALVQPPPAAAQKDDSVPERDARRELVSAAQKVLVEFTLTAAKRDREEAEQALAGIDGLVSKNGPQHLEKKKRKTFTQQEVSAARTEVRKVAQEVRRDIEQRKKGIWQRIKETLCPLWPFCERQ